VKVVARALRDAGYEVIYTRLRQAPGMVVDAALQEDAQVIGLSIHSGAHMTLFPAVVEELKRRKATDIIVFGGGIIPDDDITALKKRGVEKIFTPGTPLQDIVHWLRKRFPDSPTKLSRHRITSASRMSSEPPDQIPPPSGPPPGD